MRLSTFISSLYGQARGYRRLEIRRRVARNAGLPREAIARLARRAFERRVHDAIARYPFYAETVRAHRGSLPAAGEPVDPATLPVWTRDLQRTFFQKTPKPPDADYRHQTSGSTSKPVTFYVTRESYEWRTAVTDRGYAWGGAEEGSRSVYLWAAEQKTPPWSARVKRTVHTSLQRRWFFDVFREMGPDELAACCRLIDRVRPRAIIGYTSMLIELARFVRDTPGALSWKSATLVNAAEGLEPGQREMLEDVLARDVFLSYGSREFMMIGMECARHDGYHIAADNVMVEVVGDGGTPLSPGETGRVVVTDLRNAATPFIRYEIGDVGAMADPARACPCGLPFPKLASVDGRLQDVVYTPGGGKVTGLYVTFTMRQFDWIEGYQVVQPARERITVRLLSREALTPDRTAPVEDLLRKRLGREIAIAFERVDRLEKRATGKVALVISSVEG